MKIVETRDKNVTIELDGVYIHSKYSPSKEADKFININYNNITTAVVIGAGVGYIYKSIMSKFPEAEIIAIPLNRELAEISLKTVDSERVQWDLNEPLNNFLLKHINISNIKGLKIIEWEPTAQIFNKESKQVNRLISQIIRRINGNILTTARFGKLWIKNSIRNFLLTDSYVKEFSIDSPVVIIAPGNSLETYIDTIKNIQDKVFIIALSSATLALNYYNIEPDLIISTDPGYYSKLHLFQSNNILAMPLTNSKNIGGDVLLINQNNFFEQDIINSVNLPSISLNENGTVAGTALELALKYSSEKIYLIGQDLKSADIKNHISPYAFDNLLESYTTKIDPYYSVIYKRYLNQGVSYQTYRDWFSTTAANYPNRIYRLQSNSEKIDNIQDIDKSKLLNSLSNLKNKKKRIVTEKFDSGEKSRVVIKIIQTWLKSLYSVKIHKNPLIYLISTPKYTDVNSKAISIQKRESLITECREEAEIYLKGLLEKYGDKLLQ